MATFFANNFNLPKERLNSLVILTVLAFTFLFARLALASSGGSDLDDSLSDIWDELQAMATGNTGRILMLCMILAAMYFAIGSPNLTAFLVVAVCIIVLANASDIIDGSLTASYDLLPQVFPDMQGLTLQ